MARVWLVAILIGTVTLNIGATLAQDEDFDAIVDRKSDAVQNVRPLRQHNHQHHEKHPKESKDNFDIDENENTVTPSPEIRVDSNKKQHGHHGPKKGNEEHPTPSDPHFDIHSAEKHDKKSKKRNGGETLSRGARKRKSQREKLAQQERGWHYCSDGRRPKDLKQLEDHEQGMGQMCRDLYPSLTCCYDHDLTVELIGDKILEQVPSAECARMLMKIRCAHCSPRSWWLFHAPDKMRYPHKRFLPIMCPSFCRKFHRVCQDLVEDFGNDNFCDFHTTNEEGPCFPDSQVKRGTID